ncbi:kinectin isoform X2 [Melanotaenia boesemani]|uniref:kinectin isoform X2 n=1 Tax=Melanotaenia boesemani TaxID=1250792 RepID=UPI001C046E8A|nr:kinectin isoform X2 [Melanotaenia boesemani]
MAVDIYDSQYLLILAPSLVIALMFLFFWLFMKETSYDEVLARQKRDLKLPPAKPDLRKKNEKKKSKKKETASGGSGGGGELEEDLQDFDMTDGANSSSLEVEEEPAAEVTPEPDPPAPAAYVPVSVSQEAPAGLRERKKEKKKEKKAAKAAAAAAAAATASSLSEESEVQDSKPVSHKPDAPPAASKQFSPPSPKVEVQPQVQAVQAPVQAQTPPQISGKKKERKKQKAEPVDVQQVEVKAELTPAPVKKEAPIAAETKVLDGAPPSATGGKKKNSAKKQKTEPVDDANSAASANHQAAHNNDVPSTKGSGKKQKNEADKENTEVKLKELLSGLSSLALSEAEAISVIALLREKNPNALDAWHKSAGRPDPAAQEREKFLTVLQEEASIAKDKVKQLSQELQHEKQKTGRVEAMMREQRTATEKELGGMQAKAHQELQTMQIKCQQMREQLDSQITRLQQENTILRDAVSTATNQMESKNSAELNKLRSEYGSLMKELADSNSKLQQEEHQRKSLEVSYKQNVSQLEAQLQDAKRRWEEVQNFLHKVSSEREQLQASNQELHNKLLAAETEMNNKNKEIQTLHGSLTEAMVSKDCLEQRVMELREISQHSMPDESMQARVQELMNENKGLQVQKDSLQAQISSQATHVSHIEELQKLLADKELQRKSLEDSLNAERSSAASRETNMQALHNDNMSLKAEIQNLQAQISDQAASQLALDQFQKSVWEKEESMKTVEGLLEKGLIEVANKEEELKTIRGENEALRQEIDNLKGKTAEQASSQLIVEELQSSIQEKDLKLKSMEESLQAAQDSCSARKKTVETLEQHSAALQAELEQLRQKETPDELTSSVAQLQELQTQLEAKDQKIQMLEAELETKTKELSGKVEQIQQSHTGVPNPELLEALSEKQKQVCSLQGELAELRDALELHRKKNNELREKNWSAMEALSTTESILQGKLSKAVKENQEALAMSQAECRDVLHRLLPHVPLPSEQNHQDWLQRFEKAVAESSATQSSPATGDSEELAEKLKEAEDTQRILQKDCETYKKVLAETEGILQRLQSSVEQEESRWKVKLEVSQAELKEMNHKVASLEQEIERLTDGAELENMKREKQHLESELERAERESATYVTEVRELKDLLTELQTRLDGSYTEAIRQNEELSLLKTQLTETLCKLETEENERQKVAGDLYKAQQSLDSIQGELSKLTDNADDLIENSSLSSQREEIDRKEKMTAGLNQTVREMQQLLQAVSQQLTKGQEGEADKDLPKV